MNAFVVALGLVVVFVVSVAVLAYIATAISQYREMRIRRFEMERARTQARMQWQTYQTADQMLKVAREAMTRDPKWQ